MPHVIFFQIDVRKVLELLAQLSIITLNDIKSSAYSLPLYRDDRERSTRKQMEKDRKDPVKSHRPQPPLTSRGG